MRDEVDASHAFSILGLECRFDLEPDVIERAWLAHAAAAHPDRSVDNETLLDAALLNEAKRTLLDPERRAGALLELLGGPSASEDRTLPGGFLEEIFLVRQQMETALASEGPAARDRLHTWASDRRAGHLRQIQELFDEAGDSPTQETLRAIRQDLNVWRYIERMIEQLDPDYAGLD